MNRVIKLSEFVASHVNRQDSVEVQVCDARDEAEMPELHIRADTLEHRIVSTDVPAGNEGAGSFTQADIETAELRGCTQASGAMEEALNRHAVAVERALRLAVEQIEAGVADVCAELLQQVCEERIGQMAVERLVQDVRTSLAQLAGTVPAPIAIIEGRGELAVQLEGLLATAGIEAERVSADNSDPDDPAVLKLRIGSTVIEALIGRWRQELQECFQ